LGATISPTLFSSRPQGKEALKFQKAGTFTWVGAETKRDSPGRQYETGGRGGRGVKPILESLKNGPENRRFPE